MPVFIEGPEEAVVDQFMVANTINFCFTHLDGEKKGQKYEAHGWSGTFGMWMCLKKAYEEGVPIFDGAFLRDLDPRKAFNLFGDIPMLDERVLQLNDAGEVLVRNYDGKFHVFAETVGKYLFTKSGAGFVDRLVGEFDCFQDNWEYTGWNVHSGSFDKRA